MANIDYQYPVGVVDCKGEVVYNFYRMLERLQARLKREPWHFMNVPIWILKLLD